MAAPIAADYRLPAIESPSTECTDDTWCPTFVGVPEARSGHTAVWTGSEMIVWGGGDIDFNGEEFSLNTGGRYDPATDSWTATSTTSAPARQRENFIPPSGPVVK